MENSKASGRNTTFYVFSTTENASKHKMDHLKPGLRQACGAMIASGMGIPKVPRPRPAYQHKCRRVNEWFSGVLYIKERRLNSTHYGIAITSLIGRGNNRNTKVLPPRA